MMRVRSRIDRGGRGGLTAGQLGVHRRRPASVELRGEPRAQLGRRWRAQLEVGERRLQVQARAAHHNRPAAVAEGAVDRAARQLGEATSREGLRDRHERQQPVLEGLAFLRRRGTGQDLEPLVHLERVRRDRDRVLPLRAQPLRQRDRDRGLADPGRSEQRDHVVIDGHDR
jgi:hypothetical protein